MNKRTASSPKFRLSVLLVISAAVLFGAATASAQSGPYSFYAISPCRVVDTRGAVSTNGGPALGPAGQRSFAFRGNCGVPMSAAAVSINVTVAGATASSFLTVWPAGTTRPWVSTINFTQSDPSLANGAVVGLGVGSPDLSVYNSEGTVHVIIDVTGYYQ